MSAEIIKLLEEQKEQVPVEAYRKGLEYAIQAIKQANQPKEVKCECQFPVDACNGTNLCAKCDGLITLRRKLVIREGFEKPQQQSVEELIADVTSNMKDRLMIDTAKMCLRAGYKFALNQKQRR